MSKDRLERLNLEPAKKLQKLLWSVMKGAG